MVDVTRKDIAEILRRIDRLSDRLDSIDDDIKAAKVGGKTAWIIGMALAGLAGFVAHYVIPLFGALPR